MANTVVINRSGAGISGVVTAQEQTGAPTANPPSGYWDLWFESDGLHVMDDAGSESVLSGVADIPWDAPGDIGTTTPAEGTFTALAHTGSTLGFYGATPVAQPSAYTQTYATADKTLGAYTADDESSTYTGIDNAQAGTVYAQLSDLNALRTAYENLRALVEDATQMLNAVVDDLQTLGLVG